VPEPLAARYLAQLLSAVSHIHASGFCHRDLKPENCMLDINARVLKVRLVQVEDRVRAAYARLS
jgi:serine/threonine protein kinase